MTRSVDDIAAALLAAWHTEFAAAEPPRELLVSRGSDAWMWARALAFVLQGLEAQASQNSRDILPDQASDEAVARFGNAYGVGRLAARGAELTAEVAGPPLSIVTIPAGSLLTWTDGTLYACESPTVTINGAGVGSITVEATTYGAGTTRDAGDVLTWQSAPAGLGAFATVTAVVADGRDTETFAQWAQRILARLRLRPAAGTREEWRAWARAFQGYDSRAAWVYPLLRPPASAPGDGTAGCIGCVTVLLAGPPQGDSTVNTRVIGGTPGGRLDAVASFINGEVNALGQPVAGEQLRPVVQPDDGWTIEAINETSPVNVTLSVRPSTTAPWSFLFTEATIDPASTATSLVLVGDYASGATDLTNIAVLINIGTANYRGGFLRVVLPAGTFDNGTNRTTFDLTASPLPAAPQAPLYAYPCPGAWSAIRLAVFDYFDALTPGVATSSVDSTPLPRWPDEDMGGIARMSVSALSGVVGDVPGVVAAGVIAPTDDVVPPRKQVVTLGRLLALRPV